LERLVIKDIGKSLQETFRSAAMNQRIRTIQVAERSLKPMWSGLQDKPLMFLMVTRLDCYPQLEWHVESWRAVTKLDP
jgi:hypothetical protein